MKRYLLTAVLLSFFCITQAQLQVTGKVQTEFLEPLSNATISMEPAERSTQANENGEFQLSVPEKGSYMLRIHYLGNQVYAKTVRVQNKNQYVGLITVKSAAVEMDEVSVTGYKSPMVLEKPTYNVAKIPLRNLENAQVYSVIDGSLLDQQLIFNVDEGSRNITGLQNIWNATSRSGDGGAYVSLRGFVSTNTLRNGLAGGISGTVDAANLERLEVLKGPSGTLFGNVLASYGGMINRITKKAEDHNFGSASLSGGSNNMLRAQVDVNRVLNREKTALFRLNAAYNSESSFQNSDLKTSYFFVSPTFTYSPNTRTHITLEAEYTQGKSSNMGQMLGFSYPDTQYGVRSIKDFPIDYNLSLQGDGLDQDYRNLNLFGVLDYEISPFIKSSTNVSFSQNYSDGFGAYYYFVPNSVATSVESATGTDYVQRADQSTRDSKKNYFQIQQNFNADFKIGSMRNRMVIGLDYLRVRDKQFFYGSSFDMINVTDALVDITAFNGTNMGAKYAAGEVDFTYPLDGTTETYSAYVADVLDLTDNLNIMAGVRFDYFDNIGGLVGAIESEKYDQVTVSPKFGVVYQPIKSIWSVFGSYQNSFTNKGMYLAEGEVTKTADPEFANQWEVGSKVELLGKRLNGTVSYYHVLVDNVLRAVPTSVIGEQVQDGTRLSEGIELEVQGTPINGLNVLAGFAYNNSKYTKADADVQGRRPGTATSPYLANFYASYSLLRGKAQGLGLGVGGNYASAYDVVNSVSMGTIELPEYFLLNANVFYDYKAKYRFGIKVDNITDQKYWVGWGNAVPQKLRSFAANITYKF